MFSIFFSFFLPNPRTFSFASRLSIYNIYKQSNFYMKLIQQSFGQTFLLLMAIPISLPYVVPYI